MEQPAQMAKLIYLLETSTGNARYHLTPGDTHVLGRNPPDKGAVVVEDRKKSLSKRHVAVSNRGGTLVVVDLGSSNGTFVDGKRLREGEEAVVKPGSRVRLGSSAVRLSLLSVAEEEEQGPAAGEAILASAPKGRKGAIGRGYLILAAGLLICAFLLSAAVSWISVPGKGEKNGNDLEAYALIAQMEENMYMRLTDAEQDLSKAYSLASDPDLRLVAEFYIKHANLKMNLGFEYVSDLFPDGSLERGLPYAATIISKIALDPAGAITSTPDFIWMELHSDKFDAAHQRVTTRYQAALAHQETRSKIKRRTFWLTLIIGGLLGLICNKPITRCILSVKEGE